MKIVIFFLTPPTGADNRPAGGYVKAEGAGEKKKNIINVPYLE